MKRDSSLPHASVYSLAALFLLCTTLLASCQKNEDNPVTPEPNDMPMTEAYITDSVYYAQNRMMAYNFVYPSTDPYGQPVMLSATITMGNDVSRGENAKGLLLYNHATAFRADQCPSKGDLTIQSMVLDMGLITVSPDYYGFGATEHRHQAYCLSIYNARTCIDALQAAKTLLTEMGYRWDDRIFNAGYSQGGQTTMAVVRLAAEEYPGLDITYTIAGAGPYDLPETYRQFIDASITGTPSTVIGVILAYNEFAHLGATREELFLEPVRSHIDEWFYSKRYTAKEIDGLVGPLAIADYVYPALLDTTSSRFQELVQAFDSDNLCQGWTPRGTERIMLFHSTQDNTVPVANTHRMYDYLTTHGVQDVDLQLHDIGATATTSAHENAVLTFGLLALLKIREIIANGQ